MTRSWAPLRWLVAVPVYVWAGLLLAVMLALLAQTTRGGQLAGAQRLDLADLASMDPAVTGMQSVALPHVWRNVQRDWAGTARYTLVLPADIAAASRAGSPLAVLLPRVGVRFRLIFNGHELLSEFWRHEQGYADAGTHAHWTPLPSALWAPAGQVNQIDVEVRGEALRISGLGPVWVGSSDVLKARYQWLTGWQVHLTWMVASAALMMGLLSLLVWVNTTETLFGLLGAGLMVLAVRLSLSTPIFLPGPFAFWDYLHKLSFAVYCGLTYLFIAELFGFRRGWVRSVVLWLMALAPLVLLWVEVSQDYRLYRGWTGVIALVCVVGLIRVLTPIRRGMNSNQRLMLVVGLATLITGLRDFMVVQLGLPGDADIRWMTPGSLVLMFTMGWVLARRTTYAIDEASRLNVELARAVDQRDLELHEAVERLRVAQTQRVLEAERRRLTRDMHDGLGSQLVQTLNHVRSAGAALDASAVAAMLNHALDELRITLDSLEPMEGDLPAVLGTFRQRIAPALQGSGIELDWQVQPVPPVEGLESQGVMHLFRCLQEAFANVVKHAHATRVTVRTWHGPGQVGVSVEDNGVGLGTLAESGAQSGRGLAHLRLRAREMGAEVNLENAQPGARVSLVFRLKTPLDPSGEQPERRRSTD